MASHAKNACSGAVFTYHERQRLKSFGTQRMVVGRDSLRDFDQCGVCLSRAVDAVCCPTQGHLFCRECVCTALLAQRTEQERRAAESSAAARSRADAEQTAAQRLHTSILDDMRRRDTAIEATAPSYEPSAPRQPKGTGSCFWIPSQTPTSSSTTTTQRERAAVTTFCPGGAESGATAHRLRLKQLVDVRFVKSTAEPGKYHCPVCLRTLTNTRRCALPRGCGHVACADCLKTADVCLVCSKPYAHDSLIALEAGGTGFAAHGDALKVEVFTPAARV